MSGTAAAAGSAVLDALVAAARAQQLVRVFAAATNLSLAGALAEVRGAGGDALLDLLDGLGTRTIVVGDDPVRLLRHHLRGRRTKPVGTVTASTTAVFLLDGDLVVTGGQVEPADAPLVVVGGGGRLLDGAGSPVVGTTRARVSVTDGPRPIVLVDAGPPPPIARESERWRELGGGVAADRALARELLA